MYYQKQENSHWSENLWFNYMSFRCMTTIDTIQTKSTYTHLLSTDQFDSTGTYRLLIEIQKLSLNSSEIIFSNSFKIE
jgi:hypothetical protein